MRLLVAMDDIESRPRPGCDGMYSDFWGCLSKQHLLVITVSLACPGQYRQ